VSDQERLAELVGILVDGWYERIEYKVLVNRNIEQRAASVRQRGLIEQLSADLNGYPISSPGSRSGKAGSRPPATLDLLDLVHAIDVYLVAQCVVARTRPERLRSLVSTATIRGDEWTRETCRDLRRFIKTARIYLGYDVPARPLRDTVCGGCGGTLVVAVDADSDVRCVGTDEVPSCGTIYPKWQWIDLLEDA
jgi:hypothetical protein